MCIQAGPLCMTLMTFVMPSTAMPSTISKRDCSTEPQHAQQVPLTSLEISGPSQSHLPTANGAEIDPNDALAPRGRAVLTKESGGGDVGSGVRGVVTDGGRITESNLGYDQLGGAYNSLGRREEYSWVEVT